PERTDRYAQRLSMSYVTGTHAFKTGFQIEEGISNIGTVVKHDINYRFNNGIPNQITQYATPFIQKNDMRDLSFYGQDQWAIHRLTLSYGVRYEAFDGYVPAQHVPATASGW